MSQSQQATARISRSTFAWVLILIFLLLALSISIGGYFYYLSVQKVVKDRAYRQLSAVADLKAAQIDGWRREMLHDAEVIRSNVFFVEHIGSPADPRILNYLETVKQQYGYGAITLLSPDGSVLLAVGAYAGNDPTGVDLARQAALNGHILLSDFRRIKAEDERAPDRIQMDLAAPLMLSDGHTPRVVAVALIGIDPQAFIYPLIQTWPGASPSAETLLIRREGDAVLFLNELRHRPGTALELRIPMSQTSLPAVMAAEGQLGIVEGTDYRGIPVLAAVRNIPDSPWFMVSKVDAREIYAPMAESGRLVALAIFLLIFAAGGAVHGFWLYQKAQFSRRQLAAEQERDALAGKFDFLNRYANDIILMTDREGHILEANEKALETYGYAREDFLGKQLEALWAQKPSRHYATHFAAMQARDGALFEAEHQDSRGARFWVEVRSWIVTSQDDRFYQCVLRDITDRKAIEAALRKLNAELEHRVLERTAQLDRNQKQLETANRELEAFAYSVSHDLRSPLRGIDGYSKILLEEYDERLDDDGRFVLGQVRAAAQEMGELIDNLLEYSRLGRCPLKQASVDMTGLFKDVFEELRRMAPHRRLHLEIAPLPAVSGDALLLRGVARNLLGNAVKFTETRESGIIAVGTLNGHGRPLETTFFVRDNGVGFDMRHAHKLFGVFQRLHSQDEFRGTGVGLANVKRIVERHGGRVWAEAEPDAGAVFFFSMPGAVRTGKDAS